MISFRAYIHTMLLMIVAVVLSTSLSGCATSASSLSSTSGTSLPSMEELMAAPVDAPIEPTVLALVNQDYDMLQDIMADSFVISLWDRPGGIFSPTEAINFLQTEYFERADSIVVGTATDIVALLGFDLLAEIDGRAFYLQWSVGDRQSEGIAVIEKLADGGFHWPYILIAEDGFGTPMPVLTDVKPESTVPSSQPTWEVVVVDSDPGRADRLAILENGLGYQQYLVNAQAGQVLMVSASSEGEIPIDLTIMSPSGINQFAEDRSPDPSDVPDTGVIRRSWYVNGSILTESGTYIISLATLDGYSYAEYKVVMELYTPPTEEVPEPQSVTPVEDDTDSSDVEEPAVQESASQESSSETDDIVRVEFDPDKPITSLSGYTASPDRESYLIALEEEDSLSIEVTSADGLVGFSFIGVTDGQVYKRLVDGGGKWVFTSSMAQDYEIRIARSEGGSSYGLYVRQVD